MGAIAGIFGEGHASRALVTDMMDTLVHRGRDDQGVYFDGTLALGQRRMRILDRSDPVSGPLYNEDRTLVLAYDGEIYNYLELRDLLRKRGHRLHSTGDGEVILHLYEDHGVDCVSLLDGMFAFALYDIGCRQLLLGRDRVGEKPMCYTWKDGTLFFASEIKALRKAPGLAADLSTRGVLTYFAHQASCAPYTIFDDVSKLMPAHSLLVSANGTGRPKAYWRIDYTKKTTASFDDAKEELRGLLVSAVTRSFVADVPVGVALSGGIDSSIVLGMLRESNAAKIKTFTLGLGPEMGRDQEVERAGRMAELYETDHHLLEFRTLAFSDFRRALRAYDEPIALADAVHSLYMNKFVSTQVRVLTTGDGADVTFAGHPSVSQYLRRNYLRQLRCRCSADAKRAIDGLARRQGNETNAVTGHLLFNREMQTELAAVDVDEYLAGYCAIGTYDHMLDGKSLIDSLVGLGGAGSLWDSIGMTTGVEMRSPFYSRRVLEFAATLPLHFKAKMFAPLKTKFILKEIARAYMPPDMIYLPKLDYGHFVARQYLRLMRTTWRKDLEDILYRSCEELRAIFSREKVKTMWEQFLGDRLPRRSVYVFLAMVILFVWHEEVVVGRQGMSEPL